jgi:hypothetical protein
VRDGAERAVRPGPATLLRALLLVAALGLPAAADGPRLVPDATVTWSERHPAFGGFSAVEVLDAGARFVALTDRGHWATGRMIREEGRLIAVELEAIGPLRAIAGTPLTGTDADAEGIAIDSRGRVFVSFEQFHRIRRYDRIDGPATHVEGHPAFARLQPNSGLEALAIDADDTLYAIPERSGAWERPFPVFRKRDGAWDTDLALARSGRFLVTGADFGPDGRLYVVERDFRLLGGFRTRVRRFALGPDGFDAGTTLVETGWGELDNMEGISVWQDDAGVLRVTLLSDDNFFPLQRTLFAEFVVPQ